MAVLKIKDENGAWVNIPSLQGKSAFEIAKEYGYSGTEEEWANTLNSIDNRLSTFEKATLNNIDAKLSAFEEVLNTYIDDIDNLLGGEEENGNS